ncbi:MAG TPA: TerB family tellurite resistance protein [Polyangiaceae bacterium]|nr:TerB family tellurite resistance protein [Polyangiaceae bacterium]
MFLHLLKGPEREAFAGLAKHLVGADEDESVAEARALSAMDVELGLSVASVPAASPTPDLLATFESPTARAAVVLELLGLAYVDGHYHPNETQLIESIAAELGVSERRLGQMEDWVQREMSLVTEAEQLIAGDGA